MKRKLMCALAIVLVFALGTTAFAATAASVKTLWEQVNDKLEELREKTLTETQQATLRTIQDSFMKLTHSDPEREAKLTAFTETLSESQKAAFEEIMPKMPEGEPPADGQPTGAQPVGAPPARPEGAGTGERPAPPSGERPTGTPPARPEGDSSARPAPPTGTDGTPPAGGRGQMTEEELAAMQAKRDAFAATLTEAQKAAYEEIFPAKAPEAPSAEEGQASSAEKEKAPKFEADFSKLTSEQLAEMETQLKDLLTQLNKL